MGARAGCLCSLVLLPHCMLSQLSLLEEELIAPKPRTPDPRDQEGKREMLEFVTTTTLEQT